MTPRQCEYFREAMKKERLQTMEVLKALMPPDIAEELLSLIEAKSVIQRMSAQNKNNELSTAIDKLCKQCNKIIIKASNGTEYTNNAIDMVLIIYGSNYTYYYKEALRIKPTEE